MIRLLKLTMLICLWVCFIADPALACRYNVRETGFVDLPFESYYFCAYVSDNTPVDIISSFEKISHQAFSDSSIQLEMINIDQQKDHPALKYLDLLKIQSLPAAVLVSPDGQWLAIPVTKQDRPFEETMASALRKLLYSSKRNEILQQVSKTYGVVLLIEGIKPEENKKAKEAVSSAIEKIHGQMESMPKTITAAPVLVSIGSELFSRERILLWSLGLDFDKISEPCAAVLYGRARWIGPLMKGAEITEANLTKILYIIGQDCECGLDRRWMRGTMLPVKWDRQLQARVAKDLGFDPENPMVKMEVSRIMKMGDSSYPGVPFGYQQSPEFKDRQNPSARTKIYDLPVPFVEDTIPEKSILAESKPVLQKTLYLIAGLAVLVIAVGLFIVLRAARKNL